MHHSIPYTPQQNGVAERKNKSLKEMATCMMEAKLCHQSTGPKISTMQPIFRIGCLTNILIAWLPSNHRVGTSQMWPISGFLAQRLGLGFQQRRGRLCSPKAKSVFLLDTLKIQKGKFDKFEHKEILHWKVCSVWRRTPCRSGSWWSLFTTWTSRSK